jgi:hypothetical protein
VGGACALQAVYKTPPKIQKYFYIVLLELSCHLSLNVAHVAIDAPVWLNCIFFFPSALFSFQEIAS